MREGVPFLCLLAVVVVGCDGAAGTGGSGGSASPEILLAEYTEHVKTLSGDDYEGRLMGTAGERKTVDYLVEQFARAGLEPAFEGSFLQPVPLIRTQVTDPTPLTITGGSVDLSFTHMDDVVVRTRTGVEEVRIDNVEIVFAGYGLVAPAYGWNDYEDIDITGKAVLILEGVPPGQGIDRPYYFASKAEEAASRGAVAVFTPANPWQALKRYTQYGGPQFGWAETPALPNVEAAFLRRTATEAVFTAAGMDYATEFAAAARPGFAPTPMGIFASVSWTSVTSSVVSSNVVGVVRGSVRPDEVIVVTAHWDHFGTDPNAEGDGIYNGAWDNATGTAGLIEVAEAIAALEPPPERSVIVAALTAEERDRIGSRHYVAHPVVAMGMTVANLNIDLLPVFPFADVWVVGLGSSDLTNLLETAAAVQGRSLVEHPHYTVGASDQYRFALAGVPYLWFHGAYWNPVDVHNVTDEYDETWDLSGAVEDLDLYVDVASELASSTQFPEWALDSPWQRQ